MAVIGHAEIIVRAITNNFEKELKDTLKNVSKSISVGAGRRIGDGFADGFNRSRASTMFGKLADGLRSMVPEAEAARERFQSLVRVGYVLNGVLGLLAGAISSVVVSIGPLIGSLLKAVPAAFLLVNAFVALRTAMAVGKVAFGNIFAAVKQATTVNGGYSKSLKDIREEWQQLLFDAEAASYSEEEAALNLEKAFNNLRRMADLPPNSMARREAELEYKQAELAYRRAQDRTKDLNETVQEGFDAFRDAQRTAGGAGADPLAELNAAQRKFAERLIKLNPKLDKLKLKMSDAFLAPLYETVDVFEDKLLPILDVRLPQIAGQAGEAINQIFTGLDFQVIDDILAEMTTPFEEGGRSNLQLFGDILENILGLFLKILDATGKPLNEALTDISESLKNFTDGLDEGELEQFFIDAKNEATKWFGVIGNVFGGFRNLINLTTGPGSAGEYMLEWFTEASESFKNMFAEDPDAGKQFFKDAMVNARAVLGSIGELIKQILGLADNPNIAATFAKLEEGAPAIGEMLDKMIDAGPSFATFVVEVVELLNTLTDSKQVSAFFDTLTGALEKLNEALKSPTGQAFLDNLGPIFATLSALGIIFDVIKFGFQVLVGYLIFMLDPVQKVFNTMKGNAKSAFGGIFKLFNTPLKGGLLAVVLLLITKTVEFYNKFADFKEMVDGVAAGIGEAFGNLGASLGGLFDALMGDGGIGGLIAMLDPFIKKILELIIPFIGGVVEFAINSIASAIDFITSIVKSIMDVVGGVIDGIKRMFEGDLLGGLAQIVASVLNIIVGIVQGILNAIITGINIFIDFINGVIASVLNSPAAKQLGWKPVKISKITPLDLTGAFAREVASRLNAGSAGRSAAAAGGGESSRFRRLAPGMADGGTVFPSAGGTLVTVAEAGRPERIEPLDSNGLSQRDRAIIQQLSGGGINITVNPAPGMNEKELAAAVSRRLAFEMRKGTV